MDTNLPALQPRIMVRDVSDYNPSRMLQLHEKLGGTLHTYYIDREMKDDEIDIILKAVREILPKDAKEAINFTETRHGIKHTNTISWDTGFFEIGMSHTPGNDTSCAFQMFDKDLFDKIISLSTDKSPKSKETPGKIHILSKEYGDIELNEFEFKGEEFIPENYTADIAKQYAHLVEEVVSDTACGRLTIIDGPPGTGKTHLLNAVLSKDLNCSFVFLPSSFIESIGDPTMINIFFKQRLKGKPCTLIIEDGDQALIPRGPDNMPSLSTLLNAADGILEKVLNLHIIITTNAKRKEFDGALTRAGRLCQFISMTFLEPDHAAAIYKRLTGNDPAEPIVGKVLADVYKMARGQKVSPVVNNILTPAVLGFSK